MAGKKRYKIILPQIQRIERFNEHWYACDAPQNTRINVPSVTTYLGIIDKPWLDDWRADLGTQLSNYKSGVSKSKGSDIHQAWDILCRGGIVLYEPAYKSPLTDKVWTETKIKELRKKFGKKVIILYDEDEYYQITKLEQWDKIMRPLNIANEFSLADFELDFGGTIDRAVVLAPGEYYVAGSKPLVIKERGIYPIDLKTGKTVPPEAFLQLSAYRKLFEKSYPEHKVQGGIIIHSNAKLTRGGIEGLKTYLRTPEEMDQDYTVFGDVMRMWWWQRKTEKRPEIKTLPSYICFGEPPVEDEGVPETKEEIINGLRQQIQTIEGK